jgi:cytochrome c oxidase assembly protein subunit 15
LAWRARTGSARERRAGAFIALAALGQAGLGIATLLLAVPLVLGVLHQAGALVLFTAALWHAHVAREKSA